VKRLERNGVITGYHARVAPAAVGKTLLVFMASVWADQDAIAVDATQAVPPVSGVAATREAVNQLLKSVLR
jgi:DNA-binding Lrp family transcriptional regulator